MTGQEILEIGSLLWNRWAKAMETVKIVVDEEDDGSLDWNAFHEIRLANANKDEQKWNTIKNNWLNENREVFNEMYGV